MTAERAVSGDVVAALRRTRVWRDASQVSVDAAAAAASRVRFARDERIVRRGRPVDRLLVLLSGRVEIRVRGVAGTVSTVAVLGEGECVGETSLLTGEPSPADVVAIDEVDALAIPAADFVRIAAPDPELLRRVVRVLSDRLARADFTISLCREREVRFEELLLDSGGGAAELVGKSPAVRRLRERVAELAASDEPVLVLGEEGTKRSLAARMVHAGSSRRDAPLLAAECSDITEETWGDRLFGSRGEGVVSARAGFLEMAQGGTVLLRGIERLPAGVQERLARDLAGRAEGSGSPFRGARIVATCGVAADGKVPGGALLPALLAAFGDRTVSTPPLRERKRDIPDLAMHLLRSHAARLGRTVTGFEDQAMTRLVSYDYRFANERELDAAVARAVILAEGPTVRAEEIFFGPPPSAEAPGIDLLKLPGIDVRGIVGRLPSIVRPVAAVAFAGVLAACFLDAAGPVGRGVTALVWSVGWPALALSFFFFARAACAVCPMGNAGALAARVSESRGTLPAWLKENDFRVALGGFLLIVLAEETTGMRESPVLTGVLFTTILAGAVAVGLRYPRRTWCRHLCPLGGLAGVCATSGVLELRPSFDVCSARCTGHACFKGAEDVPGCPMFNHVMFVDDNRHCVMCMNCVRTCPNESPRLNLRLPGRELWSGRTAGPDLGLAVLVLGGLTAAMALVQAGDRAPSSALGAWLRDHRFATVCALLAAGTAAPLLLTRPLRRSLERRGDPVATALFWRRISALAPLVAAAFVAYQIGHLPSLPGLRAVVADERAGSAPWAAVSVLALARVAVMSAGLVVSCVLLWKVDRDAGLDRAPWRDRWRIDLTLMAATVGYWALLLATMTVR